MSRAGELGAMDKKRRENDYHFDNTAVISKGEVGVKIQNSALDFALGSPLGYF